MFIKATYLSCPINVMRQVACGVPANCKVVIMHMYWTQVNQVLWYLEEGVNFNLICKVWVINGAKKLDTHILLNWKVLLVRIVISIWDLLGWVWAWCFPSTVKELLQILVCRACQLCPDNAAGHTNGHCAISQSHWAGWCNDHTTASLYPMMTWESEIGISM
jgi:hypothetical protein